MPLPFWISAQQTIHTNRDSNNCLKKLPTHDLKMDLSDSSEGLVKKFLRHFSSFYHFAFLICSKNLNQSSSQLYSKVCANSHHDSAEIQFSKVIASISAKTILFWKEIIFFSNPLVERASNSKAVGMLSLVIWHS